MAGRTKDGKKVVGGREKKKGKDRGSIGKAGVRQSGARLINVFQHPHCSNQL